MLEAYLATSAYVISQSHSQTDPLQSTPTLVELSNLHPKVLKILSKGVDIQNKLLAHQL